ncbi:MAG: PcfB family protein [Lachnospiraceae bacterium]|nr:PcfB family protein [Lachnospiraceae bacterium]
MQEEVENRAVNLAISMSKLTARTVVSAVKSYLNHRKNVRLEKERGKEKAIVGKQTVRQLIGQGHGVKNIDIDKTDLKGFERVARKYGIDYAIRKKTGETPEKYLVFFKARDDSAMKEAFSEYLRTAVPDQKRPGVLEHLRELKERVANLSVHLRYRTRQREQYR